MSRISRRVLLLVAAFALFLVPAAAIAAAGFTDVADDNVFVADIEWMKDNAITAGCNPPTNDRFCPGNNVTREQMSAFMHRLAISGVVNAATAVEAERASAADRADLADHALTAESADDADALDGMDSTDFMQHATITTTVGGVAWLPHNAAPSSVIRYISGVDVAGDGGMVVGINAPSSIGGDGYGLHSFELCVDVSAPGYVTGVSVYRTNSATSNVSIFSDGTNRTTDGCYTYTVDKSLGKGGGIRVVLAGGGSVRIGGTSFAWTQGADTLAAVGEPGGAEDGQ